MSASTEWHLQRTTAAQPPKAAEAAQQLSQQADENSTAHPHVYALGSPDARRFPGRYERYVKPAFDRVVAALLLVTLSPLLALVALAVSIGLGSPVLYRQRRVGHGGRTFDIVKFRSMEQDRRSSRDAGPWDGVDLRVTHKTDDDPRHTALGRFLRRCCLDELPQLWNVVRGELSLVGPRPELVSVVEKYEPWQHQRHTAKPGMTGLWQVSERGDGLMHEHVEIDLRYLEEISLKTDVGILVRTVPALLGVRQAA